MRIRGALTAGPKTAVAFWADRTVRYLALADKYARGGFEELSRELADLAANTATYAASAAYAGGHVPRRLD